MNQKPPSKPAPAFRFPLDLVAKLAADLLPRNSAGIYGFEQLSIAAKQSVKLLNACQVTLIEDCDQAEQLQREMTANNDASIQRMRERHALEEKYPAGLLGRQYLLFVTGARSQANALNPFKRWRSYDLEVLRARYGAMARTPEQIDEEVEHEVRLMRRPAQRAYTCEQAIRDRRNFLNWYTQKGIPDERRTHGRKGGAERARRRAEQKSS